MDSERINKAKKQIRTKKYVLNYDDDALKYVQKPIGKALRKGKPKMAEEDKAKPTDRLVCELCGKEFVRWNRAHHKKSQRHQLYESVNKKLAKLVLDN
jgi:hypothetical protein